MLPTPRAYKNVDHGQTIGYPLKLGTVTDPKLRLRNPTAQFSCLNIPVGYISRILFSPRRKALENWSNTMMLLWFLGIPVS